MAALATMLLGIFGAIAQNDIKRLLSFTLVSHIGYMIFGVALATRLSGAGRKKLSSSVQPRASVTVTLY
mgnify:CR=1 FL=1